MQDLSTNGLLTIVGLIKRSDGEVSTLLKHCFFAPQGARDFAMALRSGGEGKWQSMLCLVHRLHTGRSREHLSYGLHEFGFKNCLVGLNPESTLYAYLLFTAFSTCRSGRLRIWHIKALMFVMSRSYLGRALNRHSMHTCSTSLEVRRSLGISLGSALIGARGSGVGPRQVRHLCSQAPAEVHFYSIQITVLNRSDIKLRNMIFKLLELQIIKE
jgi:hypothetical protein